MDLQLPDQRYQIDIPQALWTEFFAQLTDDNRGRLIGLKLLDCQLGDFEVLHHQPLHSIAYDRPNQGSDLMVTVKGDLDNHDVTYTHRIVRPQFFTLTTNEDGIILTCTVTNIAHAQTIISFVS